MQKDLTVVVNGHTEGELARATLDSIAATVEAASASGASVEVLAVLDVADDHTRRVFTAARRGDRPLFDRLVETDFADLGLARNAGVQSAKGELVGFFDADDLVSRSWLPRALETIRDAQEAQGASAQIVVSPELLVSFGRDCYVNRLLPSDHPFLNLGNFYDHNHWPSTILTTRQLLVDQPYVASPLGIGPEDWNWNLTGLHSGVARVIANGTALFYRLKESGSLNATHRSSVIAPTPYLIDAARARRELNRLEPRFEPRRTENVRLALANDWTGFELTISDELRSWQEQRQTDLVPTHFRLLYPHLADFDDEHLWEVYQGFGPDDPGRLSEEECRLLHPDNWSPADYRLLNPAVNDVEADMLPRHYILWGHAEGRRGRLTEDERTHLAELDLNHFAEVIGLPSTLSDDEVVVHFINHLSTVRGAEEHIRRRQFDHLVRGATPQEWLMTEWQQARSLDPAGAGAAPLDLQKVPWGLNVPWAELTAASRVWWCLVDAVADRPSTIHPLEIPGFAELEQQQQVRLLADLFVQFQGRPVPKDSPLSEAALQRYPAVLSTWSRS